MYHTSQCINGFIGHFEGMTDQQFKEAVSKKDILGTLSSIQNAIVQDLEEAEAKREAQEEEE